MFLELAESLVEKGWDVTVITGFPNYPNGIVFDGYTKRLFEEQWMGNVRVWRVYLYTSANRNYFNRILTFLSFTLSSSLCLLFRAKPDIIFAVLQPLSQGAVLPLIARLKNARLVFNIQDLHPDAQIRLGLIASEKLIKVLKIVEKFSYKYADGLTVICDHFKNHCINAGAKEKDIAVIRNWIDLDIIQPASRETDFRAELDLTPDTKVILFAGTIGHASGAEIILDVAKLLATHKVIKFLFVGEGESLTKLKEGAVKLELDNMLFIPFQPREKLSDVQATADISIVTIWPDSAQTSVPSKVLGYMAAARPVLVVASEDSETSRFILESGAGVFAPFDDPKAIANTILNMLDHPLEIQEMGKTGRRYLEQNLCREHIGQHYNDFFLKILGQ